MSVGRITLYGANEFLMSFFAKSTAAPPEMYVALISQIAPTPYVSGAELDEPQVESYTRAPIPSSLAGWESNGQMNVISNVEDVVWGTATEDWGELRYWALCSAEADGYVYAIGDMEPFTILNGDLATLFSGDLTISLGPFYNAEEF